MPDATVAPASQPAAACYYSTARQGVRGAAVPAARHEDCYRAYFPHLGFPGFSTARSQYALEKYQI